MGGRSSQENGFDRDIEGLTGLAFSWVGLFRDSDSFCHVVEIRLYVYIHECIPIYVSLLPFLPKALLGKEGEYFVTTMKRPASILETPASARWRSSGLAGAAAPDLVEPHAFAEAAAPDLVEPHALLRRQQRLASANRVGLWGQQRPTMSNRVGLRRHHRLASADHLFMASSAMQSSTCAALARLHRR